MRAILRRLRTRFLAPLSGQPAATAAMQARLEERAAEATAVFDARIAGIEAAISRIEHRIDAHAAEATAVFDARIAGIEAAVGRIEHRIDERMDSCDRRADDLLQLSVEAAGDTAGALARLEHQLLVSRDTVLELAAHVARELGDLRDAPVTGEPH